MKKLTAEEDFSIQDFCRHQHQTENVLTFSFAGTNFREVETFLSTKNAFEKAFLFFSWHYLVLSINKPLITRKILAKFIYELSKREVFVLIDVEELLLEDAIVTTVF